MGSQLRILVVDDFEMMRFQLKSALAGLGFTDVTEASDGNVANELLLGSIGGSAFDIIFCDWNMPNVSGLGVLELCRSLPGYEKVPFVMVTAEAEQETVVKAVKAGANDYIVKPIAMDALQTRLKGVFARHLKRGAA